MKKIGQGEVTSGRECRGILRRAETIQDVMRLMGMDLSDTIIFTPSASVTAITPIVPKIRGVVCTTGGATSHLAIVAREFDLPCLMGVAVTQELDLDGLEVAFDSDGAIFLVDHE